MHTKTIDFISLYNAFWYRDFPVVDGPIDFAKRADWTTHIATNVRQVASLMGLFSCFESGGRTDAELQHADRKVWAKMEWEWEEPRDHKPGSGEVEKLPSASDKADMFIFIGYSQNRYLEDNLALIEKALKGLKKPLLVILVTFTKEGLWRYYHDLHTYSVDSSGVALVRKQPALPWQVANSRWQYSHGTKS